jgi:hypothetical protein
MSANNIILIRRCGKKYKVWEDDYDWAAEHGWKPPKTAKTYKDIDEAANEAERLQIGDYIEYGIRIEH